ncbi:hypothetical protein LR948_03650 [Roseivivax sp. GX 12232]|uniref:hypothetical protein n=1 Tax=Roseivivax sp. GX 12232 TaxID=2900547 RepID=UPI001E506283|nr:hypothetical protein [Roseivivax sp. GX 12232]MCE0504437.1 hypothetical protein [Roseivivax sp. GX 12232]
MKTVLPLLLALAMAPAAAEAACYADYKAKREDPLRLHYGVAEVPDDACSRDGAASALAPRLDRAGWTLLNIVSTFGEEGLEERKDSAGQHFLRY